MRTSFHHQPEAQHPNFQLSTSWLADYPIFRAIRTLGRHRTMTGSADFNRAKFPHCSEPLTRSSTRRYAVRDSVASGNGCDPVSDRSVNTLGHVST
jgi:hypothetical protein